jgi:phage FluMu protein Com
MGRIAHIELKCPHCRETTNAYVEESDAERAGVKCEHCKRVFEFGPGTRYNPVGYVTGVPPGAKLAKRAPRWNPPSMEAAEAEARQRALRRLASAGRFLSRPFRKRSEP